MNKKINAVENEVRRDVNSMFRLSIDCLCMYYEGTVRELIDYFKKYNKMDQLCTEILTKNELDWDLYEIREFDLDESINDCLDYGNKLCNLGCTLDNNLHDDVENRKDLVDRYGLELVANADEVAYLLMEIDRCINGLAINCKMFEPFTDRTIYEIVYR